MNIYFDSNYSSQSSLPSSAIFDHIAVGGLTLPAAQQGDLLIVDENKEVDGIGIGPANHVLQSDGTYPQWTNALNLNTITSTSYKIPGTTHGDLFTVDGTNTLERVPIGAAGNILTSTGTEYEWQPLDLPNPLAIQNLNLNGGALNLVNSNINLDGTSTLNTVRISGMPAGRIFCRGGVLVAEPAISYFNAGTTDNITPSSAYVLSRTPNLIVGVVYKITISASLAVTSDVNCGLSIAASTVLTQTISSTTNLCRTIVYTATFSGPTLFTFVAQTTVSNATLTGFYLLIEPFN